MKFQVFSDIHLEFYNYNIRIPVLEDYLFLAGDIGKISDVNYKQFFDYCSENWKSVYYVLGNHEYYHNHQTYDFLNNKYKEFIKNYNNIYLLDNNGVELVNDNITYYVYGSTLWSNPISTNGLNDFSKIKVKNNKNWNVGIDLQEFQNLHNTSIIKMIDTLKDKENIIMLTHFPPLRKTEYQINTTIHPKYIGINYSNEYFANDLTNNTLKKYNISENDFYKNIIIWISGHTHYCYDFIYLNTRFISNAIGYSNEKDINTNNNGQFKL